MLLRDSSYFWYKHIHTAYLLSYFVHSASCLPKSISLKRLKRNIYAGRARLSRGKTNEQTTVVLSLYPKPTTLNISTATHPLPSPSQKSSNQPTNHPPTPYSPTPPPLGHLIQNRVPSLPTKSNPSALAPSISPPNINITININQLIFSQGLIHTIPYHTIYPHLNH